MEKIIINTDIGGDFDDFLALLLAINSPEIELKGVVTTKEDIRDKAKFAKKILNLAGRQDTPVFYSGQLKRKKGRYMTVKDYNLLSSEDLEKSDEEFGISNKGIEFIVNLIHESPGEISIVSLAPNTNLAVAMQRDPSIIPQIKAVYMMAGCLKRTNDNLNKPEHNYMRDRKSFHHVTSQETPVYIVPRDITFDLFLEPGVLEERANQTDFYKTINQLAQSFLSYMNRKSFRLSDPITLGSLLFPNLFKSQPVKIITERGKQGETVYCQSVDKSNLMAFYDFDRKRFYEELRRRI